MSTVGGLMGIVWSGTVPGADVFNYLLFATCAPGFTDDATHKDYIANNMNRFGGCGKNFFQMMAFRKFVASLKNSQAGTLVESYSVDRGTTWLGVSSTPIAIPAAGADTEREFLIESYPDWKLEWTNGGVAQATWSPAFSLGDQRAVP
jgi:hypothetical protein